MPRRVATGTRALPRTCASTAGAPRNRYSWNSPCRCASALMCRPPPGAPPGAQWSGPLRPGAAAGQRARPERARLLELGDQLAERRDVVIALDHGGDRAAALERRRVQEPHRVGHGMIVGVDEI